MLNRRPGNLVNENLANAQSERDDIRDIVHMIMAMEPDQVLMPPADPDEDDEGAVQEQQSKEPNEEEFKKQFEAKS